mgnify:CR=1 FL=1
MKGQFEAAARDVGQTVNSGVNEAASSFESSWAEVTADAGSPGPSHHDDLAYTPPQYVLPRKKWRVKRSAMPGWYKQRQGGRTHVQSAAARVARFRP